MITMRIAGLTALTMVAFAANSVLTRLALAPGSIDAASFGTLRTLSALIVLVVLLRFKGMTPKPKKKTLYPALMLFCYAVFFSYAYISLPAGTGALILFGLVQITMFSIALWQKEHFAMLSWVGFCMAIGGLVYLLLPGVTAPNPLGATFMSVAGVAWGLYSILGKGADDPLRSNAENFLIAVPMMALVSLVMIWDAHLSLEGAAYAIGAGALTTGCGYVIWFAALKGLGSGQAATVQLSVPIIASMGGVILLSEPVTWRLVIASTLVLGGVLIVLRQRQ